MSYLSMSKEELNKELDALKAEYEQKCGLGLKLDMSRGKPDASQLDLSMGLRDVLNGDSLISENGTDCRNYGVLDGISEAKKLMGAMMGADPKNVIVCGVSSLNIMYDTVSRSMTHGVCGSTPWMKLDKPVKFLCPVPGYDRHFAITEFFGIEMINIPMDENGPDMELVKKYAENDPYVKGVWCVPKYSNPGGISYSDEVVRAFAALKPAAEDFRIFWDNAYCIHHLYETEDEILNILVECKNSGNEDMVYEFASTSKVTMPGSGISAVAASDKNIEFIKKQMTIQTIGHDKINQLRHVKFFGDIDGMKAHMKKHAELIRPKFELVLNALEKEIKPLGIGTWVKPHGGYFISFNTIDGCAKRVVALCREAGVTMTGAGASYPYGKDPEDKNIRIAPTFPTLAELEQACEIFVLCVKIAGAEKILETK